jgi:hypothetical protein
LIRFAKLEKDALLVTLSLFAESTSAVGSELLDTGSPMRCVSDASPPSIFSLSEDEELIDVFFVVVCLS